MATPLPDYDWDQSFCYDRMGHAVPALRVVLAYSDARAQELTGIIDQKQAEIVRLADKLKDYELAAQNPGDGERHRGTSTATQLVHCQHMRTQTEEALLKVQRDNIQHRAHLLRANARIAELEEENAMRERAERAEALNADLQAALTEQIAKSCDMVDADLLDAATKRAKEAEAERDALRNLLRRARPFLEPDVRRGPAYGNWSALIEDIDAAMRDKEQT